MIPAYSETDALPPGFVRAFSKKIPKNKRSRVGRPNSVRPSTGPPEIGIYNQNTANPLTTGFNMSERFELPDDFTNEVRLFPLPDLVMFPSNVQPLHVFEERYREMLEDALMGDRIIAMATLQPGYDQAEYHSRPALAEPICVGKIATCERTEQGTYNLLLVGLKRAVIEHELPPHRAFREAKIQILEDDFIGSPQPHEKTLARTIVERIQRRAPGSKEMLNSLVDRDLSLAELTDVLAYHINLDLDTKLSLLSEPVAERRARIMLESMPERETFDDGELPPFSMN